MADSHFVTSVSGRGRSAMLSRRTEAEVLATLNLLNLAVPFARISALFGLSSARLARARMRMAEIKATPTQVSVDAEMNYA